VRLSAAGGTTGNSINEFPFQHYGRMGQPLKYDRPGGNAIGSSPYAPLTRW